MTSYGNDVLNLSDNTHVLIKIYRGVYDFITYIANEGRHVRILYLCPMLGKVKSR